MHATKKKQKKKRREKSGVTGDAPAGLVADHVHVQFRRGLDDVLHVGAVLFVRQACKAKRGFNQLTTCK